MFNTNVRFPEGDGWLLGDGCYIYFGTFFFVKFTYINDWLMRWFMIECICNVHINLAISGMYNGNRKGDFMPWMGSFYPPAGNMKDCIYIYNVTCWIEFMLLVMDICIYIYTCIYMAYGYCCLYIDLTFCWIYVIWWCIDFEVYIHDHTCIHTYMHSYIHSYIHTFIHTYIHTYIHTHYQLNWNDVLF